MLDNLTVNNQTDRFPELAIPARLNFGLLALHSGAGLLEFFILPIYLIPANPWWRLTMVPLAALNSPLWALLYECVHAAVNASPKVNLFAGRGSVFHLLLRWRSYGC